MTAEERFDCASVREAIHAKLDAAPLDTALRERLEAHLAGCSDCRELAQELRRVQQGLRSLPELQLPDDALEQVWSRTTGATRRPAMRPGFRLAAAAVLVVALGGLWLLREQAPPQPTEAELHQAAAEARLVLQLSSRALRRTEQAAFRDVLTEEISGALRRAPIQWPERSVAERRGS